MRSKFIPLELILNVRSTATAAAAVAPQPLARYPIVQIFYCKKTKRKLRKGKTCDGKTYGKNKNNKPNQSALPLKTRKWLSRYGVISFCSLLHFPVVCMFATMPPSSPPPFRWALPLHLFLCHIHLCQEKKRKMKSPKTNWKSNK